MIEAVVMEKILCDGCGRSMTASDGTSMIGVSCDYTFSTIGSKAQAAFEELYPELKGCTRKSICVVCWWRSMGVKI